MPGRICCVDLRKTEAQQRGKPAHGMLEFIGEDVPDPKS